MTNRPQSDGGCRYETDEPWGPVFWTAFAVVVVVVLLLLVRCFNARFGPTAADRDVLAPKHMQRGGALASRGGTNWAPVDPGAGAGVGVDYNHWAGGLDELDRYAIDRHRRDAFNLLESLGIRTGHLGLPYGQPKNQVAPLPPLGEGQYGLASELAAHGDRLRMVSSPKFGLDAEAGLLSPPRQPGEFGLTAELSGNVAPDRPDGLGLNAELSPAWRSTSRTSVGGAGEPVTATAGHGLSALRSPVASTKRLSMDSASHPPTSPTSPTAGQGLAALSSANSSRQGGLGLGSHSSQQSGLGLGSLRAGAARPAAAGGGGYGLAAEGM